MANGHRPHEAKAATTADVVRRRTIAHLQDLTAKVLASLHSLDRAGSTSCVTTHIAPFIEVPRFREFSDEIGPPTSDDLDTITSDQLIAEMRDHLVSHPVRTVELDVPVVELCSKAREAVAWTLLRFNRADSASDYLYREAMVVWNWRLVRGKWEWYKYHTLQGVPGFMFNDVQISSNLVPGTHGIDERLEADGIHA